jgi:hypothetical protein
VQRGPYRSKQHCTESCLEVLDGAELCGAAGHFWWIPVVESSSSLVSRKPRAPGKSLHEAGGSHDDVHRRPSCACCSCVLEASGALVDFLTSWPSHSSPRALLTICRSVLRGSIRCLAVASPVAPSARVAISAQHFCPAPMCSHCTSTARGKPIVAIQTPPVTSIATAAPARQP